MVMVQLLQQKRSSYSWWFDSHKSPRQSPWLLSTLSELEEKTTKMLKLIEEDADSFAQRAEMYYKKRPELVNMVEDFYRAHRSLAEQIDQLKLDNRTRHTTPLGSPTRSCWLQNLPNPFDKFCATPEQSESEESEVDDPEDDDCDETDSRGKEMLKNVEDDCDVGSSDKEILKRADKHQQQEEKIRLKLMAEELEKLKEESRALKGQLEEKDEEKREVIRQLSLSMSILKEENVELKKRCVGASRKGSFDIKKLVFGAWPGRLFSELQLESRTTLVAL